MYEYLLPLSIIQIIIFNIISKLPAIIYKSRIIYKANNSPYKQGPTPSLIYYRNRFHQIYLHDLLTHTQHTATSLCPSLYLAHTNYFTTLLALLT